MKKSNVLIRKYPDRRLYDTNAKRYVKLADIAAMIREGIDVEVLDARSKKDLTRVILTQIIIDDARDRETGLPLHFLRQLVMASDRRTHEFLSWYLNSTLDLYHKAQQSVQSRISDAKAAVASPLDFVRNLLAGQVWPPTGDAGEDHPAQGQASGPESKPAEAPKKVRRAPRRKRTASKS